MADIITAGKAGKRKLQPPRIDFTPMVDLGFLLITFFIYTTTMAKPKTMELNMPSNEPTNNPTKFIPESTISLIPFKDHKIVYYYGALDETSQLSITTNNHIRDILLQKEKQLTTLPGSFSAEAHKLHVLIKPAATSTYADMVQVLDEMNITNVPYYAIVDLDSSVLRCIDAKFK